MQKTGSGAGKRATKVTVSKVLNRLEAPGGTQFGAPQGFPLARATNKDKMRLPAVLCFTERRTLLPIVKMCAAANYKPTTAMTDAEHPAARGRSFLGRRTRSTTCDDDEGVIYQAGAFPTEAEAQKVVDIWRAEGRQERMAINIVPFYQSAEEWQADR